MASQVTTGGALRFHSLLRLTRTGMTGTPDPFIENMGSGDGRILSSSVSNPQSLGSPELRLTLRNDDHLLDTWKTGDSVKVEASIDGGYAVVLDGCLGPIVYRPLQSRRVADVVIRGWGWLLDTVNVPVSIRYENSLLTSIADDLLTETLGSGFQRSITADPATVIALDVPAGMKLREALDLCRRGLCAGTDKWEHGIGVGSTIVSPDASGHAHDAILRGTVALSASPFTGFGNALPVSGTYAEAASDEGVFAGPSWTAECRFRTPAAFNLNGRVLLAKYGASNSNRAFRLRLIPTSSTLARLTLEWFDRNGVSQSANGPTNIGVNQTVHGVLSFDGTRIDLVVGGTGFNLSMASSFQVVAAPFTVGADANGNYSTGIAAEDVAIDEVRVTTSSITSGSLSSGVPYTTTDALAAETVLLWHLDTYGGQRFYSLAKRSATVQRVVEAYQVLPGSQQDKGDIAEVANRVIVNGATIPAAINDQTLNARAGYIRPAATTTVIAQPFRALDTPLRRVAFYADRSVAGAPPTLRLNVARDSDYICKLSHGLAEAGLGSIIHVAGAFVLGGGHAITDADALNPSTFTGNAAIGAGTEVSLVTLDLGADFASKFVSGLMPLGSVLGVGAANVQWAIYSSPDDSSYTLRASSGSNVNFFIADLNVQARYWQLRANNSGGVSQNVKVTQFDVLPHRNEGLDAGTDPYSLQDYDDTAAGTGINTTGNVTREMAFFDLGGLKTLVEFRLKHADSGANGSVNYKVQVSLDDPGTHTHGVSGDMAWIDLAVVATTGSATTTQVLDAGTWRAVRVILVDGRAGGSASFTSNILGVRGFFGTAYPIQPHVGDAMGGGQVDYTAENLTVHPGVIEAALYEPPRLGVQANFFHWLILQITSGATANSWWDLAYSCSLSLASLSAFWSFDESTGGNARDGSANGLHLAWTQNPSLPVLRYFGKVGRCIAFDTSPPLDSNCPSVANNALLTAGSAFTAAFWVYPIHLSSARAGCLGKQASYAITVETTGKVLFEFKTGGVKKASTSTASVPVGAWSHVVVRYDGTNVLIDIDGERDSTTAQTGAIDTNANAVVLGSCRDMTSNANINNGKYALDEVSLWQRVLSDAEVALMYSLQSNTRTARSEDSGTTFFGLPFDTNLLHYEDFKEGTLTATAEDTASQNEYVNLVPGGVLTAAIQDDSLRTRDAVEREAAAILARRKVAPRRVRLVLPRDSSTTVGARITLSAEAAYLLSLGTAALDLDVVQATSVDGEASTTTLDCDEYPLDAGGAHEATIAYATGRTT